MRTDERVLHLPEPSERLKLVARAAMLLILGLALLWLFSAVYGAWLQGTLSLIKSVFMSLAAVMWLSIWRGLYRAIAEVKASTLMYAAPTADVAAPTLPKKRHCHDAKTARVHLLFDAGHHVLIHVQHASGHALHCLPDAAVPLVWRWRLAAKKTITWQYLTHG